MSHVRLDDNLYGDGIYLSKDIKVAKSFMRGGPAMYVDTVALLCKCNAKHTHKHRKGCLLGSRLHCVAVVEVARAPNQVLMDAKDGLAQDYVLVKDEHYQRVSYATFGHFRKFANLRIYALSSLSISSCTLTEVFLPLLRRERVS